MQTNRLSDWDRQKQNTDWIYVYFIEYIYYILLKQLRTVV